MTSLAVLFGFSPSPVTAAVSSISLAGVASGFAGEQLYTTAGTYNWTVPTNLTSVSVVCIGGGRILQELEESVLFA